MAGEEKLGAAINLRISKSFRLSIDELATATGWTATDIARIGLIAFWPDIAAMVLATKPNPDPQDFAEIRETARLFRNAREAGLNLREVLVAALEENVASQVATGTNGSE